MEQKLNKPKRYRKLRTGTVKQSGAAINKKLAKLKLRDLITKQKHSSLKPSVPKTPKARPTLKTHKDPLKMFDYQHSKFTYIKNSRENTERTNTFNKKWKELSGKKFVDKIRNIKLEQEETMISFNISGMYPILPK